MAKKITEFLSLIREHPLISLFSPLCGLCLGALIYFYHFQLPLFSKSRLALCALIALAAALLIFFLLLKLSLPVFSTFKRSKQIAVLVLAISFALLLAFTLQYTVPHLYPFYPTRQLRVEMDLSSLPSDIEGVSLNQFKLAYRDVSFNELQFEGQYEPRADSVFFPAGQVAAFQWQGVPGEQASLAFEPTPHHLRIEITWDDSTDDLDLFQAVDVLSTHTKEFPLLSSENLIIRLLSLPLIMLVLFVLACGLLSPHPYACIMLAVWLFAYLLYYPGIIGSVNILAVDDLLQGHPTDWHPLLYTLLAAFNIKYLASASSLLVMQFVSLALVFGRAFTFLQEKGVSKAILLTLSLLIALLPNNFLSMILLTNDIPYSIALLALTFLSFKIVITNGKWLDQSSHLLLLSLTASLAILFRYNGIPAVAFFFLCLLLLYPKYWLRSLLCAAVVAGMWFVVSGPLSTGLNVSKRTEGHFDNILLHHISAHLAEGTPFTEEESAYLDQLLPLDQWSYNCCTNAAMWANDNFDREAFHANSAYNQQLALSLFQRAPGVELSHMLCASDMVWDTVGGCPIEHPVIEWNKGSYYWTGSYFPEYRESSFLPSLVNPVSNLINRLEDSPLASALLWRPAWYLYLAIIGGLLFARRFKSPRALLVLTPILGQSLFLLLVNRVQNFRYQYCAVLVAWLLLAIAFYKPEHD